MNPGPVSPDHDTPAASAEPDAAGASERPQSSQRGISWLMLGGVAIVVMMVVRGLLVQSFYVPSGSMEPTIEPGDRILVDKLASGADLQRGDIVVFDGTTTFATADRTPHPSGGLLGRVVSGAATLVGVDLGEQDFVKRVVGLPGDHVVCCDQQGRLTVNGVAVDEPYLYPGDRPSELTFDIVVPEGRLWVMGDHRSDSADSRAHLGDPGGGTVRLSDVVGRAFFRYWPLGSAGGLGPTGPLASVPREQAP